MSRMSAPHSERDSPMTDLIGRPKTSSHDRVPQAKDAKAAYEPVMSASGDRAGQAGPNSTLNLETEQPGVLPPPPAYLRELFKHKYNLKGMLGSGGMGDVCLAWDPTLLRFEA